MVFLRLVLLLALAVGPVFAQAEYRVYNEHPRLWLEAERLQRLRKDVERQTVRWTNLQKLIDEGVSLPEDPLVRALQFQAAADQKAGRQAIDWALARAQATDPFREPGELRLGALVFDWCHALLQDDERSLLAAMLGEAAAFVATQSGLDVGGVRDALLASVAVAGEWGRASEVSEHLMGRRWKRELLPALQRGELTQRSSDLAALLELCHVSRHNFERDLWLQAPGAFKNLPYVLMLGQYPDLARTPQGLFRRPALPSTITVDPAIEGSFSRLAAMLLVGYDNAPEPYQFLQGWLRHDSLTMTSPFGTVYEFLWLNPYLPGLSYFSAPVVVHDKVGGRVFARAGWQEEDVWLGYLGGQLQLFADGQLHVIGREVKQAPLLFPGAAVVLASVPMKLKVKVPDGKAIYLVGLGESQTYSIKVSKNPFRIFTAGRGGIVVIENRPDPNSKAKTKVINFDKPVNIRIRPAPKGAPSLRPKL